MAGPKYKKSVGGYIGWSTGKKRRYVGRYLLAIAQRFLSRSFLSLYEEIIWFSRVIRRRIIRRVIRYCISISCLICLVFLLVFL